MTTSTGFTQTLDEGLKNLSEQIALGMSDSKKQKIAVIEFSDLDGKITEFGKFLSEELITRLFISKKFNVIERQLLNKVIEENKFTLTGLVDETTAKELGRILGLDAICSGTITDLGNYVKVNARLISTETGSIFSVASIKIDKDDAVRKLMGMVSINQKLPLASESGSTVNVAGNLILNGDFKQDISAGWIKEIDWDRTNDKDAGTNYSKIVNDELFIHHDGNSKIIFTQDIRVISTNLLFKAKAKLRAGGYVDTESKSRILIYYMSDNKILGSNAIECSAGWGKDNKTTPTHRHIFYLSATNTNRSTEFQEFVLDIEEELSTYLIGVPPEKVNKIRIKISCEGVRAWDGSLGMAEMWAKSLELKYK